MALDRGDFENLNEADLIELVTSQVPEGLRLEYKRDLYGSSDADKREFLKDTSAFANGVGGHLLIGIEEQEGVAARVPGIQGQNPDEVVARLGQLVRDGVEPRIQGLQITYVRLASGGFCVAIKVPRSWAPPHRVIAQNSNRFWVRNAAGAHEASIEELRDMFTLAPTAHERIAAFRDKRLDAIRSNASGARSFSTTGGYFVVHVVPLSMAVVDTQIDLASARANHQLFQPMAAADYQSRYNFDGFIAERSGQECHGYTQVFRSGALEATRSAIMREWQGQVVVPGLNLEAEFFGKLDSYMTGLHQAGAQPPFAVMLTLCSLSGAVWAVQELIYGFMPPAFDRNLMQLPLCLINDFGPPADYQRALRPALDALWNAAGYEDAQSYDAAGTWTGNLRR